MAPKWVVGLLSALLGFLVFSGGLYGFYAIAYEGKIFPNTIVGTIQLGGLTLDEAEAAVLATIRQFEAEPLRLTVADTAVTLPPADVKASYDARASVQAAYDRGRSGTVWANLIHQAQAVVTPTNVPLAHTYDEAALEGFLDRLSERFDDPEQNADVEFQRGALVVTDAKGGERFNRNLATEFIVTALATATHPASPPIFPLRSTSPTVSREQVEALLPVITGVVGAPLTLQFEEQRYTVDPDQLARWVTIAPEGVSGAASTEGFFEPTAAASLGFDDEAIGAYVKTLATDLNQEPVDAKLTITNGKASVFQQSQDGRSLDETQTAEAIIAALRDRRTKTRASNPISTTPVTLVVNVTKPTVSSSTIGDLGINELVGTATTDFSGSPDNRIHNIKNGTKFLNGWLVKPGDEFSTVRALGTIDSSTGYLPELVIKENRTIPEFGGGLCQVSTTLFRAVLNAGLPITERRNHSYRVVYYERGIGPGLDATVYLPKPDLRFKNDTPGWILVQGSVSGLKLTFELYGTRDGREVTIDGPHTLSTTPAPPAVYERTDTLAPGETKQIEKPHDGASTTATYTVKRSGEVINTQTFTSKYKALPARYLQGPDKPAESPPEQPSETTPVTTDTAPVEAAPVPAEQGNVAGAQDPAQPAQ